jgi:hypothetical protein
MFHDGFQNSIAPRALLVAAREQEENRHSGRPLGGPAKKSRLGEERVPKGALFGTVEQPKSRKLLSIVVGRRTSENPPARLLLPGGICTTCLYLLFFC